MNVNSLVVLARLMSNTYGVNVVVGGSTASTIFEGNRVVITIPVVSVDTPEYKTLIRGYIDHEVGHVRFTERGVNKDANHGDRILPTLLNIFEDVYVERLMTECYPGCKRNLKELAELLFVTRTRTKDFKNSTIWDRVLSFVLYYVRSVYVESLSGHRDWLRSELDAADTTICDTIIPILDRVPAEGTSTCNNLKLAQELIDALNQRVENQGVGDEPEGKDSAAGTGNGDEGAPGEDSAAGTGTGSNKAEDRYGSEGEDRATGTGECNAETTVGRDEAGAKGGAPSRITVDLTNTTATTPKFIERLSVSEAVNSGIISELQGAGLIGSAALPADMRIEDAERQHKLSDRYKHSAERASAQMSAQIQSLLQAQTMNYGGAARRGNINTRALYRTAINRSDVFHKKIESLDIDTEIIILLDASGSMGGEPIMLASAAMYSLAKTFLSVANVTLSVYSFRSDMLRPVYKPGAFIINAVTPVTGGSTYCGEALIRVLSLFTTTKNRRIVVMITDGDTANSHIFEQAIQFTEQQGVELYGIGIAYSGISKVLPPDRCCVINDLNTLASEVLRMLRKSMISI